MFVWVCVNVGQLFWCLRVLQYCIFCKSWNVLLLATLAEVFVLCVCVSAKEDCFFYLSRYLSILSKCLVLTDNGNEAVKKKYYIKFSWAGQLVPCWVQVTFNSVNWGIYFKTNSHSEILRIFVTFSYGLKRKKSLYLFVWIKNSIDPRMDWCVFVYVFVGTCCCRVLSCCCSPWFSFSCSSLEDDSCSFSWLKSCSLCS